MQQIEADVTNIDRSIVTLSKNKDFTQTSLASLKLLLIALRAFTKDMTLHHRHSQGLFAIRGHLLLAVVVRESSRTQKQFIILKNGWIMQT